MQSHYNITEIANGYSFETDFGLIYELTFLYYPIVNTSDEYCLYMFNIEQIKKGETRKDDKIRTTVEYVLRQFFEDNFNAIIIVLDSFDNRQSIRKRLFDSWFQQSKDSEVEKIEAICFIDDLQLITMLLVGKNNPIRNRIKEDYFDLVKINFYS